MKKQTFTQIPDNWGIKHFDLTSRFLVASILRWQTNGNEFYMKRKTFCNDHGISPYHFDKAMKKMQAIGIIVEDRRLAKNIGVYKVCRETLQKCLLDTTNFKIQKCNPLAEEVQPLHFTSEEVTPLEVKPVHHSITKEDTKEITKVGIKVAKEDLESFFNDLKI